MHKASSSTITRGFYYGLFGGVLIDALILLETYYEHPNSVSISWATLIVPMAVLVNSAIIGAFGGMFLLELRNLLKHTPR